MRSGRSCSPPGAGSWKGSRRQDPTVLVFEDLHWADEAMLAFLEHLADLAEGVPLLLVGTARPELYERHPDYADGMRNVNTINLAPLTDEETARLVSALLDAAVIPAELQQPILERAGGNPLYAEEFVRLLRDRDLLVQKGSSWELREGAEVPFPDSVQALIAARLDTLEPDAKSLLADAAVIGKVFWAGAVAAMGDRDPQTVTRRCGSCRARNSCDRHGARRWRARRSTRSGMCLPVMSPTTSSRAPPARPGMLLPPGGSSRRHPSGSKTSPTCSPTTTPQPSTSPARQGNTDQAAELRSTRAAVPRPCGGTRARPRHRCGARELRAGTRPHPRRPPRAGRRAGAVRGGRFPCGTLRRSEGRAGGGDRRVPGGG